MSARLLLDEHSSPALARRLRDRGHDVVAVLDDPALTGSPDDMIFAAAVAQDRRIVTENVADFRVLLTRALSGGLPAARLLLVSTSRFGRAPSRVGALAEALSAWAERPNAAERPLEDWLQPPCGLSVDPS